MSGYLTVDRSWRSSWCNNTSSWTSNIGISHQRCLCFIIVSSDIDGWIGSDVGPFVTWHLIRWGSNSRQLRVGLFSVISVHGSWQGSVEEIYCNFSAFSHAFNRSISRVDWKAYAAYSSRRLPSIGRCGCIDWGFRREVDSQMTMLEWSDQLKRANWTVGRKDLLIRGRRKRGGGSSDNAAGTYWMRLSGMSAHCSLSLGRTRLLHLWKSSLDQCGYHGLQWWRCRSRMTALNAGLGPKWDEFSHKVLMGLFSPDVRKLISDRFAVACFRWRFKVLRPCSLRENQGAVY